MCGKSLTGPSGLAAVLALGAHLGCSPQTSSTESGVETSTSSSTSSNDESSANFIPPTTDAPNHSPKLTVSEITGKQLGTPTEFVVELFDSDGDAVTAKLVTAPEGAEFINEAPARYRFHWIPDLADVGESHYVTVEATDGLSSIQEEIGIFISTINCEFPDEASCSAAENPNTTDFCLWVKEVVLDTLFYQTDDCGPVKDVTFRCVRATPTVEQQCSCMERSWINAATSATSIITTVSRSDVDIHGAYRCDQPFNQSNLMTCDCIEKAFNVCGTDPC